ncbi:hypothetical protein VST7929_02005 [Vibrio stylophorae]|uniref:Flagellar protein n=1 Tax=Vibrio stylophorae TaxID=659351 RepID=A0ABN8DZ70_9VIBR|nr:flagellar biosynthetic protein FliO [Vibrio stylophorae]CAH0534104.1 hypothetical protein VST7929_02005 [Vibrio stylophorae]
MARLLWIALLFSPSAWAVESEKLDLFSTVSALFFVLVLIFVLAAVVRKMRLPGVAVRHQELQVVAQLPIGPKERLMVVQVGEQQVLLGVTAQQINQLAVLEQPLSQPSSSDFASQLGRLLKQQGQKGKKTKVSASVSEDTESTHSQESSQ